MLVWCSAMLRSAFTRWYAVQKCSCLFWQVSLVSMQVELSGNMPRIEEEVSTATESTLSSTCASTDTLGLVSLGALVKHKSAYDSTCSWEKMCLWVYFVDDGLCIYCCLCHQFNTRSEQNHSTVFNEMPCVLHCNIP